MFKQKHLLFEEAGKEEETGSGSSEQQEQKQETDYKALYESTLAEKESVNSKNSELLGKLKSSKDALAEIESKKQQNIKAEAEASGDIQKVLDIANQELESIKAQLADKEENELSSREQLLKDARVAEFKKQLGDSEFHNIEEALKTVDWSKFVMENDEAGNPKGFNADGVKQAIEGFREQNYYHIKSKDANLPANQAKGSSKEADAHKENLKKFVSGE